MVRELEEMQAVAMPCEGVLSMVLPGRKCCLTGKGYLAWVPKLAVDGDLVCVLKEQKVTYATRYVCP